MSCRTCHHRWCWVCGSNLDQFHTKLMEPACAMINLFVLHEKIPNFLRYPLAIITMILMPPIMLICCLLHFISEYVKDKLTLVEPKSYRFNRLKNSKKKQTCIRILFCSQLTGSRFIRILQNFFIAIPFWIIYCTLILAVSLIIWCITILPAYLYAMFALLKCMVWWCKNKRVNTYDLTDEQKILQGLKKKPVYG